MQFSKNLITYEINFKLFLELGVLHCNLCFSVCTICNATSHCDQRRLLYILTWGRAPLVRCWLLFFFFYGALLFSISSTFISSLCTPTVSFPSFWIDWLVEKELFEENSSCYESMHEWCNKVVAGRRNAGCIAGALMVHLASVHIVSQVSFANVNKQK